MAVKFVTTENRGWKFAASPADSQQPQSNTGEPIWQQAALSVLPLLILFLEPGADGHPDTRDSGAIGVEEECPPVEGHSRMGVGENGVGRGVGRVTQVRWSRPLRTRCLPRRTPQVV